MRDYLVYWYEPLVESIRVIGFKHLDRAIDFMNELNLTGIHRFYFVTENAPIA